MAPSTGPVDPIALLRPFFRDAEIPQERWGYLEFSARRYPPIVRALADAGPLAERKLLDLGGGVGSLSVVLHAVYGGQYELAEFEPPRPAHADALARRGVARSYRVDLTSVDPLVGLPSDFDGILFVEVLEHLLVNPLLLFRTFWNHLRPGGFVFLTTPNMARLGSRVRLLAGQSIKESGRYPLSPGGVMGHVVEYTRPELDQMFRVEGFRPVAHRVIQQMPSTRPSAVQRTAVGVLNLGICQRLELGDDILALYQKVERAPVRITDASGRL